MIGQTDGIEAKLLDLPATPQKFVPRHVGQHKHGKS
jgi:hypothetical protein